MSLATLQVRSVTIITAGTRTDAYGDSQLDWTAATEAPTNGWLAQQSSSQDLDGRDATATNLVLVLPAGTAITARERVRIDGRTYSVSSEPTRAWTPRGEHHVEASLEVIDG